MSNLISKYNISEKDLYSLGIIESKKKSVGYLEKEKLKAVSLKILKPYNVKFMDLGGLLSEIKEGRFDDKYSESITQEEKSGIEKMIQENSNVSKFYKEWWSGKSKKQKWVIAIAVLFTLGLIGNLIEDKNKNSNSSNSNINSASEEVSKKAYRAGYKDGQMGYGLPASERATAMESYLAHNYNFSSADIPVYEMGYNDAVSGKSAEY